MFQQTVMPLTASKLLQRTLPMPAVRFLSRGYLLNNEVDSTTGLYMFMGGSVLVFMLLYACVGGRKNPVPAMVTQRYITMQHMVTRIM